MVGVGCLWCLFSVCHLVMTSGGRRQGLNAGNLAESVESLVWNDELCREHLTEQVGVALC